MKVDTIEAVGIDAHGSLWVRPSKAKFPMIYREARGVQWHHVQRHLFTPTPRDWTSVDWFLHILLTVKEAGTELRLTLETEWVGVDEGLRRALESA